MKKYCYLLLLWSYIGILKLQNSAGTSLPQPDGKCEKIIKAEARTKYATTPGFPNPFPGDAKCVWAIYTEPGKRIRLEFQKFFLLQPVAGKCEYHYVIVKSPFTLFSMGPYCGETGLPTIVSTGNLIYVELHTLVPVTTDNYQGFKLAFKETVESSSYELRSDNSVDDEIVTIDPETMNMLSPTAPTTTTQKPTKSTTKPWRFRPSRRPPQNTLNRPPPQRRPRPPVQQPPDFSRPPLTKTKVLKPSKKQPVKIEIIVGIVVGGLIAVAIIIMIALRLMTKQKPDKNGTKGEKKSPEVVKNNIVANEKSVPLPAVYPDPSQAYFYDETGTAYAIHPMMTENNAMELYQVQLPDSQPNHSRRVKQKQRKRRRQHDRRREK